MTLAALALLLPAPLDPPSSAYDVTTLHGWTIKTERRLRLEDKPLFDQTHALLARQLKEITTLLPPEKVKTLQKTVIWVDRASRNESAMVYHPSREWLVQNKYNPDKADGVELSHPDKFLAWTKDQPYMVLHELAHAYHDQVLGFDHKRIAAAYEAAKATGKYDLVKHVNGQTLRHYGLNNPMEFFAEMTEAYFGKNDFYPYTRQELKTYDPPTYKWIEQEWLLR